MTDRSRADGAGAAGQRAAQTVAELRAERSLSKAQLSRLLAEVGRPMTPDVITKIENGQRRIDVDDLMALALALDVTPNLLLLPPSASRSAAVDVVFGLTAGEYDTWRWARGEPGGEFLAPDWREAEAPGAGSGARGEWMYRRREERKVDFSRNRPDVGPAPDAGKIGPYYGRLQDLWLEATNLAKEAGWTLETVLRLIPTAAIGRAASFGHAGREVDDDAG